MKIVIFVSYAYPFIGSGLGQVASKQAEGLVKAGHEVVLVSSNFPKTQKRFIRNGVLYLKEDGTNFLAKFDIPVPLFLFSKEVVEQIKTADIVHTHDFLYPYSLQAGILSKFYKKPLVLTQHAGFIVYKSKIINLLQAIVNKTLGKLVIALSDKIIFINEEVKSWLGVNGPKTVELINGVDRELFKPVSSSEKLQIRKDFGLPLDKQIVLYVGRLVEKKGYHRVYAAKSSQYFTVIAGGGDRPDYMKDEKDEVLFLGQIPQEKLSLIYQASDIFVLPSDCEGFPLSIQEAMATGLPIITSKHPGFDKYLDEKYVKFISPEVESLRNALAQVLRDDKLRKEMEDYSIEKGQNGSWNKNVEKLINIYGQLQK